MEHVILLDESGNALGHQDKRTVHTASTPLHLAFSCYIFNADDQVLVTRRSPRKLTWPGVWTNSVCGHPQESEPMVAAVSRRAAYELGLALDEVRLLLPRFRYRAEWSGVVENEMCPVFTASVSAEPRPRPDEVDAVRWMAWPAFLREATAAGSSYSPWCQLQATLLAQLGPDRRAWPAAPSAALPPAGHALVH
ncbi:isopentenyl-diphosphate Delta-isomerase [Paractinoplanes globisporus]|uniref:Isopentenyl-diphosphate Delta-isomerase n=1 Tax=Paractinoplanes globisporus TaxID=113565 RepID=A0ABW6W7U2_9ACTN|nr:isopentenyl-diphosphate Delta-isomerase [Actinoplanes globisporus]